MAKTKGSGPPDAAARAETPPAADLPEDRVRILDELADLDHAYYGLWRGRDDAGRRRRPSPDAWSLVEIVRHVADTDAAYLEAIDRAVRARPPGPSRGRPLAAGPLERLFLKLMEPSSRWRFPAPRRIRPPAELDTDATWRSFQAVHGRLRDWIRTHGGLDLGGVRFANPFVPGARFRASTGLLLVLAHGRRHLGQARRAVARVVLEERREAGEGSG